jgi:hypothetical protein
VESETALGDSTADGGPIQIRYRSGQLEVRDV